MTYTKSETTRVISEVDYVALPIGEKIGRYEVVSVLGQGGFGITYCARDQQLGREVAIKEYLPSALAVRQDGVTVLPRSTKMADDFSWGRQRFLEEGRTLATLQRAPSIVRVYDFLEAHGTAYIIMELVPGDTLENRLRIFGKMQQANIDRLLWPLLDGLEQVHNAGFLHRDIKPANILLDATGNATLIDFGASRAAMAGRSTTLTAIFTPGYAAAEQITSAKQGPWTDIYGLSATLYHAVTGKTPPSAFDRMLNDEYEPLSRLMPPGFAPGLLVGIDAGLAVRATDRPQSIAGWRQILRHIGTLDSQVTVTLASTEDSSPEIVPRLTGSTTTASATPARSPSTVRPPMIAKRGKGTWIGLVAAVLLALGGGSYFFATKPTGPDPTVVETARKQQQASLEEAAKRNGEETELAKLRAEAATREKAEAEVAAQQKAEQASREKAVQEAEFRRQIEEETRHTVEAEMVAKQKAEEAANQKAEAGVAAAQKAEADAKKAAAATETGLHLALIDRQRIQVALTALGFDTKGTDGVLGAQTRVMIAEWQKARSAIPTGFITATQTQALLKEAAPAISTFEDDLRKTEEAKKKADERALLRASKPSVPAQSPTVVPSPVPGSVASEPGPGNLARGQTALVDDGTCPAGQIKEVTGGSNRLGIPRTKKCISRP
jgi:serine/threonine protein kinase